jgi:rfaE bifunctional protein nucleotidyltransferase chain/domain
LKVKNKNLSPDKPISPLRKGRNLKIVLVGGCFDILHLGHVIFLEKAKRLGDKLVVLLESDENIKKNKGNNRPVNNQENRAKMLMSLKAVSKVIKLPEMKTDEEYLALIKKIKPSVIAITGGDKRIFQKRKQAKIVGARLVKVTKQIPYQSTSRIVDIIAQDL